MIAFATGGLLGDVFFHLIPHAFMGAVGEDPATAAAGLVDPEAVRVIMVEEKRNVIIGVCLLVKVAVHRSVTVLTKDLPTPTQGAIFFGFFAFFFLDKTMRVLSSKSGDQSSKGHSHHHGSVTNERKEETGASTGVEALSAEGLRHRKNAVEVPDATAVANALPSGSASLKLSAYLNLFGDFSEFGCSKFCIPCLIKTTSISVVAHNITDGLVRPPE
jgi:zinc transporter 7